MSWTGQNWTEEHPRFLADLTGDRRADVIGFGSDGVWVALNTGNGTFAAPVHALREYDTGWRADKHPRLLADLTGDGRPDLVGFGYYAVRTALNNGDGTFRPAQDVLEDFCESAGGWQVARHLRFLADLTGDGRADIVGFGEDGVFTALGNGDGTFQPARRALDDFAPAANGWRVDRHPRFLADVTGDGRADIVAFGDDDVYVALSNGDGTFAPSVWALGTLVYNNGWRIAGNPRFLADITGDGRADVVGFGPDGMWTALSTGGGGFTTPRRVIDGFTDWLDEDHLRLMVDITGDGRADMVGFNEQGMWTARSNGDGTFIYPGFAGEFGRIDSGWRARTHPRYVADLTGDGRADVVGFGDAGVWTSFGLGNGSFYAATLPLQDFGAASGETGVRHIFSLMLENRSFDHLLGFSGITGADAQTGAPTTIDGVTGAETNEFHGVTYPVLQNAPNRLHNDPGHSFDDTLVQLCGYGVTYPRGGPYPASGFATSYGLGENRDPADVMGCCSEAQLPYLHQLAREYVVCDRWFASHPGHTWPNRVFVHAATSGGMDMEPDKATIAKWELVWGDGLELAEGTIYDRLRDAGFDYRLYHDDEPAPYLPPMVSSLKGVSVWDIDDVDDLASDLADPSFRDVRYIHIEPSYDTLGLLGPYHGAYANGNSQHPLGDVRRGDQLIRRVYETIRNSPVWEQSLLIITWDEHGGFYDHVAPPPAVAPGDRQAAEIVNEHQFAFDRLGARVPAVVISPLIPKNLIDHRTYDHTSVLSTVERLLALDPLTERDRLANSLHTLLRLPEPRADTPARLVTPVGYTPPRRVKPTTATTASTPDRSIGENQVAGFLYAAYTQDIELSPPSRHAAIRARVAAIQTHQEALDYMRDVARRVAAARDQQDGLTSAAARRSAAGPREGPSPSGAGS